MGKSVGQDLGLGRQGSDFLALCGDGRLCRLSPDAHHHGGGQCQAPAPRHAGTAHPFFNRNQGKIARERATRQRLFDAYVDRVFEARSDVTQIVAGMAYLNARIAAACATQTDLSARVDTYRTALDDGRTGASAYYAAWNDLIAAKTKVLDLEGQLAQAVVALELATGNYEIPMSGLRPHPSAAGPGKAKTP